MSSAVLTEQINTAIESAQDEKMSSPAASDEKVGGIDFNPNMLELQTQGAGIDFDIPIDPQAIQSIQIDGFSPVIFQIVPTNLPLLLGILDNKDQHQLSLAD